MVSSSSTASSTAPKDSVILSERSESKNPEAVRPTPTASTFSTTDGSLALAPEPTPAPEERPALVSPTNLDLDTLQQSLVAALAAVKGQQSASDAIHDATLTLTGDTLNIQTTFSKHTLAAMFNADANRILTAALRASHPNLKLSLLPGTAASATPKKKRAAAAGSAQDLAENHPMVKEAKRLFSAEISNVIDLRDKD